MNIKLLGKNLDDVRPLLKKYGMSESEKDFELIVTYGGDGALLGAERDYPGVPKLAMRDRITAPTCKLHEADKVLKAFCSGELKISVLPKLCAEFNGRRIYALNDLFLHTLERSSALRYRVAIDGELYTGDAMGDGVCLSSVHGSTAYYRSITRSIFRVGIGLAFSNSTEAVDHLVLADSSVVEITVVRGPGIVIADNDPEQMVIDVGESVKFFKSDLSAAVYGLDGFMCSACRLLRHPLPGMNQSV